MERDRTIIEWSDRSAHVEQDEELFTAKSRKEPYLNEQTDFENDLLNTNCLSFRYLTPSSNSYVESNEMTSRSVKSVSSQDSLSDNSAFNPDVFGHQDPSKSSDDLSGISKYELRCATCSYVAENSSAYLDHIASHPSDTSTFSCPFCSYITNRYRRNNLEVHIRRHTGERPYQCSECSLQFVSSGDLKSHGKKHSGQKPFPCPHCNYRSTRKSAVKLHCYRAHKDIYQL